MKMELTLYFMDRQLAFSDHVPKDIRDRAFNRVKEQEKEWHHQMCQELWKDKTFTSQLDHYSYEIKRTCETIDREMAIEDSYGKRDDRGEY